jgi:lysophospholipase L1-like esterase
MRRVLILGGLILLGIVSGLVLGELAARLVEVRSPGNHRLHAKHPVLGWIPAPGEATWRGSEYAVTYHINALGMNDAPVDGTGGRARLRVMAVGDSNTFGQGVQTREAWPKVLEGLLFDGDVEAGRVYNLGVIGYNLGQYLLRMREFQGTLRPHLILVGFSMHNDLYDLIPPRLGGFAFGQHLGRAYFDLDAGGNLVEIRDLVGKNLGADGTRQRALSPQIRGFLARHFALYRRYRTSKLAMWAAARFRVGGQLLWSGVETAVKKRLDSDDQYRWRLAEKLIEAIRSEAEAMGAKVVLVNIPYLPQAYDDVWETTFGRFPEVYDRWIGGAILAEVCRRAGVHYIDATQRFVEEARRTGRWLHYREDWHPTAEGHKLIAEVVAAGLRSNGLLANTRR